MENLFAMMFEDVTHERSLIILLSPTDPDILKQSNFTDHWTNIYKGLALEKLHRQWNLKETEAVSLTEG